MSDHSQEVILTYYGAQLSYEDAQVSRNIDKHFHFVEVSLHVLDIWQFSQTILI
jgi:hypothetical protein